MPQTTGLNLLARLLEDGRLADFYRLKREYFYDREIAVFDRINEHVTAHGILPTLSFLQRHAEIDAPDSADPYGVWYDEYVSRALYSRFSQLLPEVQRDLSNTHTREALDRVINFIEETHGIRADGQSELSNVVQVGQEVLAEFARLRGMRGLSGIPSGWPTLDRNSHGFQRGDLIIFSARPGVGKTTIAIKLALEAHRAGYIPLFVSMEMKRVQIGARLFAMDRSMNLQTIRRGELSMFGEQHLAQSVEQFSTRQPFYIIEGQFRQSVNELASLVHSLRPDILIVDGAYLLKLPHSSSRMPLWEKIGEITQILKSIISNANIPGIATFQINREGGKRDRSGLQDAGLEHLQLSDAIGQLASLIVAILSDEGGDSSDSSHQRRMKVLKGREGESGQWFIHWDYERMNFNEIIDPIDAPVHTPEPEMEDLLL